MMTLNDLEMQKAGFSGFFAILGSTHISTVNCTEITRNKPAKTCVGPMKFLA